MEDDEEKRKLIEQFRLFPVLWTSKGSKNEKHDAMCSIVEEFGMKYTEDVIKKTFHSLQTSMMREVKRELESKSDHKKTEYKSPWKFYESMVFLKDTLIKCISRSADWNDDERSVLINFYRENPSLWDHTRKDYLDRDKKRVLMEKLTMLFDGKYTENEITNQWNNTKTYFDRENMREIGSKKTGSGTEDVYVSHWKFMKEMRFVRDVGEQDKASSTLNVPSISDSEEKLDKQIQQKRKVQKDAEFQEKRMKVYDALHATLSHSSGNVQGQGHLLVSEEDLFGRTIAEKLKKLTPHLKALAEKRIMDAIFDVKFSVRSNDTAVDPFFYNGNQQMNSKQLYNSSPMMHYTHNSQMHTPTHGMFMFPPSSRNFSMRASSPPSGYSQRASDTSSSTCSPSTSPDIFDLHNSQTEPVPKRIGATSRMQSQTSQSICCVCLNESIPVNGEHVCTSCSSKVHSWCSNHEFISSSDELLCRNCSFDLT